MDAVKTSTSGSSRLVRAPKTAELIAEQLRSQIVRGVLKQGAVLPTEIELVKQFGVSRPTLREAFRILESESLIIVRRGSRGGVLVSSPPTSVAARDFGLQLQMLGATLADVYEARKVLEPAAVRMLATRREPADVADLRVATGKLADLVNGGAEGADFDEWSAAALQFHDLLIERSGNITIALFGAVLRDIVTRHMSRAVATTPDRVDIVTQFKKTIRVFTKVTGLVESGDADAAEQFWRSHMDRAGKGMLWGDLGTETVIDLFV